MSTPTDADIVAALRAFTASLRQSRLDAVAEAPGAVLAFHGDSLIDVLEGIAEGRRPAGLSVAQVQRARRAICPSYAVVACGIGWEE